MKKVLSGSKYLFLFLFCFVLCCFTYSIITSDAIWNFGFSYAIARGEVPYVDFNMVVPPFSPFVYLIPFLFSHSYIVYLLFHSVLFVVLFCFLEKLFGNKVYLLLILLVFPLPSFLIPIIFPGYNFLLILLFTLLLYLEKKKCNDYIIGILLGLCIFTKQSVGVFFVLPSLYYLFKDRKKFLKRLLGIFGVCLVFLGYFLLSGSFFDFLNCCVLGMFDFQNKNQSNFFTNFYFWLWFSLILVLIYFLIKKDNKMFTGYLLSFSTISYPLFDHYHVGLFLFVFCYFIFSRVPFSKRWLTGFCFSFSFIIYFMLMMICHHFEIPHIASFPNFEMIKISEETEKKILLLSNYLNQNKGKNIIFLTNDAYFFKIIHNLDITYYDLLNYGNHGYHGTERLLQNIENEHDAYFVLSSDEYQNISSDNQFNMDVVNYVINNYPLVEKEGDYEIYQKVS